MKNTVNMKVFILLCIAFVSGLSANAQGIVFSNVSFEEALEKAQQEGKQIFVDVYTSWCGPCKMIAKNVFTQQKVGEYYNEHFICLKLDAEKEAQHDFFKSYKAAAYPSFFWLDAQGGLLDTHTGMLEADAFIQYGKEAGESNLNARLEEGRKRWESGERSLELVNDYVLGVLQRVHPSEVKAHILEYLTTLSEDQLKQKENYLLMKGFMRQPEDNIACRSLIKYADTYQSYEEGYGFWVNMYRMIVRVGSILRDKPEEYAAHIELLESTGSPYVPMYLEILDLEQVLFQKDFQKGVPLALEVAEKYKDKHSYLYSQFYYTLIITGFFDDSVQDEGLIDEVIALADEALTHTPSKETLLYLAAAHAKRGDYKKAYELMASEPFFPKPILSTALYPYLHLKAIHHQYLDK